jgi:hypothetical protein
LRYTIHFIAMEIQLKYFNPSYNIGLADWRNAWLLTSPPVRLPVSVHQGTLTYRLPKNGVRISYTQLKKDLQKCRRTLHLPEPPLPF